MSEEDDFEDVQDDGAGEDDQLSELTRRHQRFIALGGGIPIQQELRNLKKLEAGERVTLKDQVTDQHRILVADLAAAGLSHDMIAKIFGLSQTYLETLFEYELGTGFDLAKANLTRSLFQQGLAGSTRAALGWLRNHNRSNWRSKTELSGPGDGPIQGEIEHKGKTLDEAKAWLGSVVGALMVDKEYRNKEDPKPPPIPGKDMKAAVPAGKKRRSISKPREEQADDNED